VEEKKFLEYMNRISHVQDERSLLNITLEVQNSILQQEIKDEKNLTILTLALNLRSTSFLLQEFIKNQKNGSPTIIIMGDPNMDFAQMQLDDFYNKEMEEFQAGTFEMVETVVKKLDAP